MSSRDPYDDRYDDRERDRERANDRDPDAYDDVEPEGRAGRRDRFRQRARDKVSLPAMFLIIFGLLSLAFAVMMVALLLLTPDTVLRGQYDMMKEMFPQQQQPPYEEYVKQQQKTATGINAVRIILSALIVIGGIRMRSLQNWGLALAASIIAIIPLCPNECCCTLPFGIWSLVVLLNADVKRAFSMVPGPEGF
jgi:hypothetical protein